MNSKKMSFMRKLPLWTKFFSVSILLMFLIILVMTLMSIIQMRDKETNIIQSNISNSIYYTEQNTKNALSRYIHQVGSQQVANNFYDIKMGNDYRYNMRKKIASICSEDPILYAVFYVDSNGEYYSAGEIFGSINSQISMINDCKSKPEFTKGDGLWRYARAGRDYDSLIWCKDIIYVDSNYAQQELGTIMLYLDSKRLSEDFFGDDIQTYTAMCDMTGTFAIAQDESLIGQKFSDVFTSSDDASVIKKDGISYLYKKEKSSIYGWDIISYIEMDMTGRNVTKTMTSTIVIAFLGLIGVFAISYILSKRLGRPIEELLKYIRINRYGEIDEMPDGDEGDIAKIRAAFEEMSLDLRSNIENNYEMQLKLNEITIKAYESQINPHFLFNTLYMIQMMNVLGEKENITTITNRLGKLLRFNLDNRNEVKLSEEIENVKNYLDIMELRFKGRFNYKIMIPPELMDCYTVKFMLQPLIENSVSHGFVNKKDMCEIVIMAQQIGDDVAIVVKDNGQGITPERLKELKELIYGKKTEVGGIGIKNVHDRIQLLYGNTYGIDIFSDYAKNTNVLIHIPVSKSQKMEVVKDV